MYTTLNKQTSFFVALSLTLVLFSTCKKDNGECNTANIPTIDWQKTIGGSDDTNINSVQQTTDGGYIIAGYNNDNQNGGDYWIVKLNSNADIKWEKIYGGSSLDKANCIQQTTDGGYIVAGYSYSADGDVTNNKGYSDAWILKLTANGNIEWQKTYGGSSSDHLVNIKQTTDNGYIATGYTNSSDNDIVNNQGDYDYLVIKIDTNGNLEWTKTFGGTNSDIANDVQQTTNGEYLIAGYTFSNNGDITNNHGGFDAWVIKINSNGNLAWQRAYGGSSNDYANCIQKTNDGHCTIAGYTFSSDGDITNLHGGSDAWVIKIDDLSNILQQTTVGTNDNESANSILETNNNNLLITGYSRNVASNISNIFVATLNTNSTLLWQRKISQDVTISYANFIFETTDCGYILFGKQFFENLSSNDIIIKLK
ncbi:MAG: hypothetical protein KA783_08395 [Chitinophagales bacterium]|jgi:hypothetical protein|nr:hypothetical protein [Chitinophagales bacterium]